MQTETSIEALQKLLDQVLELTDTFPDASSHNAFLCLALVLSPLKLTQNKEKHPIRESEKATA